MLNALTVQSHDVAIPSAWIMQSCSTFGCFTAIRVRSGQQTDQPICKWCRAGTSHTMRGFPDVDSRQYDASGRIVPAESDALTKEEFGLNLYEAVKLIGGILTLDSHLTYARQLKEEWRIQGFTKKREALQKELAALLPRLTEDEDAQLRARYPFVVSL